MSDIKEVYLSRMAESLEEISSNLGTMTKILSCIDDKLIDLKGVREEMDTLTSQMHKIANR